VSDGWCQIAGVNREQALGDGWSDNVHPDDREQAITAWQQTVADAVSNTDEFRILRPDGSVRWVHIERVPEFDDHGRVTGFAGTRTDVTERKDDEARLRIYEQIADASPDLMTFIDRDYRYMAVNNAYLEAYQLRRDDMVGHTIAELNGEERFQRFKKRYDACLAGEGIRSREDLDYPAWGLRHMDISFQPIRDQEGEVVGIAIVGRDITDLHQAETDLKQIHAERGHILDNANISIVRMKDRKIVNADHWDQKLWGWSPDEYLNSDSSFFYADPDEYQQVGEQSTPVLSAGQTYEAEVVLNHKDGHTFPARIVGIAVDPSDLSEGSIWLTEDITQRKQTEDALQNAHHQLELRIEERTRELRAAMEQAEAANSAKSKFLSSMSHELRTPMNAVLGFTQLLQDETNGKLTDEQKSFIAEVMRSGTHMVELIDGVLDLAKIEDGKTTLNLENLDVPGLVAQSVSMIESSARKQHVTIENKIANADLPKIHADRLIFRQALLNFLSNAVKYNHSGGQVTVDALVKDNDVLRVSVQDTGPGIPKAAAEKVFEPFERLGAETSAIPGTGVGLAVTKQLIESMGGAIGFDSMSGAGTTFWFEVPLAAG